MRPLLLFALAGLVIGGAIAFVPRIHGSDYESRYVLKAQTIKRPPPKMEAMTPSELCAAIANWSSGLKTIAYDDAYLNDLSNHARIIQLI